MSDLKKYIENRKKKDSEFGKNYDSGYNGFKFKVLLKQAKMKPGYTQEQVTSQISPSKKMGLNHKI